MSIHVNEKHRGKTYPCDLCNEEFGRSEKLRMHKIKVHNVGKGHTCKICHKVFNRHTALTQHVRTVHEKMKDYVCDLCGVNLATRDYLKKHLKNVHKISKPQIPKKSDVDDPSGSGTLSSEIEVKSAVASIQQIFVQTVEPSH